ncbi:MAG TPA: peroxiredoxin-like family protein [Candidatus Acidoferrales bacterium]|jgi:peroxiredoxin|nr:peroxiredoxin-like family protein [Candidatus Acidoferrales bacterium]
MIDYQTTRELKAARAKYRGQIIPKPALAVMDAETSRLAASGLATHALEAGDAAPDFILPDVHGEPVRLQALLDKGPVVVVFYRGGWCPYCNLHLRGFQRRLPEFHELGATVVAISPQLPDNSLSTREKDELAFPVLSDVGNKVARQFGIVFELSDGLVELYRKSGHALEDFNGADGSRELPVPATFLLDGEGIIHLAHVDVDYTRRIDPDDVIGVLRAFKPSKVAV